MNMRTDYASAGTQWACNRKKAYPDQQFAKKVARTINERDKTANVVEYGCTRCGRWHIGRAPKEG